MQNEYFSDSSNTGQSEVAPTHAEQAMNTGFAITPQDADVLQQHLEEFQGADTSLRSKIIEKAMTELYQLRPANTPFNKKEASKVSHMYICLRTHTSLHDSENTEVVLQSLYTP
jgi:hypothetical protein